MIINFDTIEETSIPNFYGGNKEVRACMQVDGAVKIMRGILAPGASIGLHTHETSSEILYALEGAATVLFDGTDERLDAGMCHYCPKGHSHSLINSGTSDLVFLAVVPNQ